MQLRVDAAGLSSSRPRCERLLDDRASRARARAPSCRGRRRARSRASRRGRARRRSAGKRSCHAEHARADRLADRGRRARRGPPPRSRRARRAPPPARPGCRRTCRRRAPSPGASMISARPSTPESGRPAAIDFATVIRSGSTPKCSIAKNRPVRPKPVCTSSATSTIPCSSQIRAQPLRRTPAARRRSRPRPAPARTRSRRPSRPRPAVDERALERRQRVARRRARGSRSGTARGRPRARTARAPPCTGASSR